MLFPWRRQTPAQAADARTAEQSLRLRRIFDDTHDLAWRMLRRFGVPADRVEDLFQQVFLITSERLDDIRPGRERAFVYGVALRVARGFLRTRWREVLDDDPDLRPSIEPGADALLDRRRLVEVCDRILERLKPELREVFVLHELEGLSGSELAELLKIPEGTAYSRLRRARMLVRAEVEALGPARSSTEVRRG